MKRYSAPLFSSFRSVAFLSHQFLLFTLKVLQEMDFYKRMYTIAYADYHVKVVESHSVFLDLPLYSSMFSGCCKKCNNLFFVKFPILQHVLYMP